MKMATEREAAQMALGTYKRPKTLKENWENLKAERKYRQQEEERVAAHNRQTELARLREDNEYYKLKAEKEGHIADEKAQIQRYKDEIKRRKGPTGWDKLKTAAGKGLQYLEAQNHPPRKKVKHHHTRRNMRRHR
jgi:hypothetical protein